MLTIHSSARAAALAAIFVVVAACDSVPPTAVASDDSGFTLETWMTTTDLQQLAQMRQATAKYHNIAVARADGYVDDGFGCVSDPDLGGMGWHLISDPLHADPSIDPLRPELLIYEPQPRGGMQLIAMEYEVYQADWLGAGHSTPPSMFGKEFEALVFPGIDPVYGLHVWLWRNNPAGMFEDFNPKVQCR